MLIPPELLPSIVTCLFFSNEKRISKKELVHYHKLTTTQYVTHQRLLQNLWWRIDYYNTEIVIVYKTNQLSVLPPPTHPMSLLFNGFIYPEMCAAVTIIWLSVNCRTIFTTIRFILVKKSACERNDSRE